MTPERRETKTVLAIASSGGHWVQLQRLRPAFEGHRVVFASVRPEDGADVEPDEYRVVPDATRWNKVRFAWMTFRVTLLVLRLRPDVIISTGAAPGFVALRVGAMTGAKTCWLDSIANTEQLSESGRRIGPRADLWLTQWPDLASPSGPTYAGSVL